MRKSKSWDEFRKEYNNEQLYRINKNISYSNSISVNTKIVSNVFTIEFTEEQCMVFEDIFKDYLRFQPPEYNKLENQLVQTSKDFFEVTNQSALQCILYCSKIIPMKRFDRKLIEVLSNVVESILKYADYKEFEKEIRHIINNWSNWIPQLKVAIRISYKIDDIEFLEKIYDNYMRREEFYWEVFYMLLRSGQASFIPLILEQVLKARSTSEKDSQIRNLFKNHFKDYYSILDAQKKYSEMQKERLFTGGHGQKTIESVISWAYSENDFILKIKTANENEQQRMLKELLESLDNERQEYDRFYNVYNAMRYINNELKIEVLKWIVSYLSKVRLDASFNKRIAREMIFRLAFNSYLYQESDEIIDNKYGKVDYFVGVTDIYNLYIGKTNYDVFTRNFLTEHNNKIVDSYIYGILRITRNTETMKEFNKNIVAHLNSYLRDDFLGCKKSEYNIRPNISVALINLKKLIIKDKKFFVKEMRSIFEKFFGYENDSMVPLSPVVSNSSMEDILTIIDSIYINQNDRGFNNLLFKIRDSNISPKLTHLAKEILKNKGGIGLPTDPDQAEFLYNDEISSK